MSVRAHDVKHLLHKEVFHPNGERLVGFTQVSKTEPGFRKKENVHYLCSSVSTKRPYKAFICRYRKKDNGDGYEERRKWPLEELKKVDGHTSTSLLFDLYFDRAFKFETTSVNDKEEFLESVANLISKYLDTPAPPFVNVSTKVNHSLPNEDTNLKRQMAKNKEQLAERGEKLSDVHLKTAEMANSAQNFSENTKKLREQYE